MKSTTKKSFAFTIIVLSIPVCFAQNFISKISADKSQDESILTILQVAKIVPLKLSQKIEDQISKSNEDHAVLFFASWCEVCRDDIALFLQKVKSGKCSRISFVSVDEDKSKLDKYLLKIPQLSSNIYWDQNLLFSKKFNIKKLPTVVYLDRKKNVKRIQDGSQNALNLIEIMVASADGRASKCE